MKKVPMMHMYPLIPMLGFCFHHCIRIKLEFVNLFERKLVVSTHWSKVWNFSAHCLPHRCAAVTHAHCCGTFFHFFVESLTPHNCGKGLHVDVEPNSTAMWCTFPHLLFNYVPRIMWKLIKYYSSGFCSIPNVSFTNRK